MPTNPVEVDFVVDDSQVRKVVQMTEQGVRNFQSGIKSLESSFESMVQKAVTGLTELDEKMVASGERLAKSGKQLGFTPAQMYARMTDQPGDQAALVQYAASLERVESASERVTATSKQLMFAEEGVGEAAEQAGRSGFGSMLGWLERSAAGFLRFMVVWKAIELAIKAVTGAIAESIKWESAVTQFKALSDAGSGAEAELKRFMSESAKVGQSKYEYATVAEELEAVGESVKDAADNVITLGKYATITHLPLAQLAKDFEAVSRGMGSTEQMRQLAQALGTGNHELRDQVNSLEQSDILLGRMETQWDHINSLTERAIDSVERHKAAIAGFSDHLGLGDAMVQRMAYGLGTNNAHMNIFKGHTQVASINLAAAGAEMRKMLQTGEQRLMQETNISGKALAQLEAYGFIKSGDLMGAYNRQQEDTRRNAQFAQEDARYDRAQGKLQNQLTLQQQITQAIKEQVGVTENLAKAQDTAEVKMKQFMEDVKSIAANLGIIAQALSKIVGFLDQGVKNFTAPAVPKGDDRSWQLQKYLDDFTRLRLPNAAELARTATGYAGRVTGEPTSSASEFAGKLDETNGKLDRLYDLGVSIFGTGGG